MTIEKIKSSYHHAFTLIKLLVVISAIALLIALLLPTLDGAHFAAKVSLCGSNMRQFQIGTWLQVANNVATRM